MARKKIELQPSEWGIVVDKSNATKTFPLRGTVFQKGSRLNYERNPRSRTNNPSKEGNLSTIGVIVILLLFLVAFCLIICYGIAIADLFIQSQEPISALFFSVEILNGICMIVEIKQKKPNTMKTQNPVDQLKSFFQDIIDELYEYIEEAKRPDPPPTPRTEPTAFQEFTQELRDNWKVHPLRINALDLVKTMRNTKTKLAEAIKRIKENKKKFKLHKS